MTARLRRRQLLAGSLALGCAGWPRTSAAQPAGQPRAAATPKPDTPGKPTALVGATLWRGDAPPLDDAVVVFDEEGIRYLGTDPGAAATAQSLQLKGKIVTVGLVDPLTRVGLVEVSLEKTTRDDALASDDPVRAAFRAADGYDPTSSLVAITRAAGVTSVGSIPTGGLVSGQSTWADLAGASAAEALARRSLAMHAWIGDEHSTGTSFLRLRELLDDTRSYRANKAAYDRNQLRKLGASRLDYEAMARVLERQLPLVVHVDRASDILGVLALAKQQNLRLVLASAAEAWKVAKSIADAGVGCIVYPLDEGPRSFAARGAREDNAALLHRAGVRVALSSGETHNARKLRQVAGNAVRAGLPARAALAAVTETPAELLAMGDPYGSPKQGRTANLVVWSADPFELSTRVEQVFIRGKAVSLRSRQTALFERYR